MYTDKIKTASGRALQALILAKYGTYAACAREWGVTRQLPYQVCREGNFNYKVALRLSHLFNVSPVVFCYEPLVVLTRGKIAAYESFIEEAFKDKSIRAYIKKGTHIKYRDINTLLDTYTNEDPYGRNKKRTTDSARISNKGRKQEHGLCDVDDEHDGAD